MSIIRGKSQRVYTIGVFAIASQNELILELEKLNAARCFSDKDQISIASELDSSSWIVELKELLRRSESHQVLTHV